MLPSKKTAPAWLSALAILCLASTSLFAQDWRGGDRGQGGPGGPGTPPMERSFHGMEHRWWDNPRLAQQVGLTDDQKKKMSDIAQQHRLQLIDLNAALEKQEAIMRPLIEADQPDESKILSQIDSIAQARAELEKNRARMLFSIRQVLTPDQWKKLQTIVHEGPKGMGRDGNGPGRGGWNRGNGKPGAPDGGGAPNGQPAPPPPGGQPSE
jgi:periplasmic protein CpxP/Spy